MAGITVDTNILVRIVVDDDPGQSAAARDLLDRSEHIAVPSMTLCELVWVLSRFYRLPLGEIAATIRRLVAIEAVRVDRLEVMAGLAMLDAGGDFADGVIAHGGQALGGVTFISFDRAAVARLNTLGVAADRLS